MIDLDKKILIIQFMTVVQKGIVIFR